MVQAPRVLPPKRIDQSQLRATYKKTAEVADIQVAQKMSDTIQNEPPDVDEVDTKNVNSLQATAVKSAFSITTSGQRRATG